jgi:hypothetical protein
MKLDRLQTTLNLKSAISPSRAVMPDMMMMMVMMN